ncbi:hypothetical protein [Azospirillum brasilense]
MNLQIKNLLKEERAIAKAAARLVSPGQTLFLDFGSTVSALAEELASLPDEGLPATFGEGAVARVTARPHGRGEESALQTKENNP